MTKTVDLSGVFATNYPPLSYEADAEGITFRRDTMTIRPLAAEVREVTVTATDALGQKATTTFTLNSRGLFQTVAAGEVRDNHYIEVDGKMVRTTLLEPEAVNHLLWSGDMTNPYWIASGSTVTGDRNEILIQESAQNQPHGIEFGAASGVSGTLYAEVKPAGRTRLRFGRTAGGNTTAEFDLDAVTATPLSDSTGTRIVALDDGWYRIETDGPAGGGRHTIWLHKEGEPNVTYLGDGASGVRVRKVGFGTANGFVPTYGAPATRKVDSLLEWEVPSLDGTQPMTAYTRFIHHDRSGYPLTVGGGGTPYLVQYGYGTTFRTILPSGAGVHTARPLSDPLVGGEEFELLTQANADGSGSFIEIVDGVEYTASTANTAAGPRALNGSLVQIRPGYGYIAVEIFSGVRDLAYCRANRGDIFSYRPGDPLPEGVSSRASAALQNAPAPADLPSPPAGWVFAFPDEAYPGGRVPVRDHEGAIVGSVVQGVDDAVGTSDPAITREGWSLDGSDSLKIDLVGDLDVTRAASDVAIALTTTDNKFVVAYGDSVASEWLYAADSGSSSTNITQEEALLLVDGVPAGATRTEIHAAAATGAPVYIEARGAYLTGWGHLGIGEYTGFEMVATVHGIALYLSDTEATDESRAAAHAYVKARLALRGVVLPDLPEEEPDPVTETAPPDIVALVPEGYSVAAEPTTSVDSLPAGTTYTHPADFIAKVTQQALPADGFVTRLLYHFDGSANAWYTEVNNAGRARLMKVVGGTPTQSASANGVMANGQPLYLVRAGNTIAIYANGVLVDSVVTDAHAKAETDGLRNNLIGAGAEGGTPTNLRIYPLTPA